MAPQRYRIGFEQDLIATESQGSSQTVVAPKIGQDDGQCCVGKVSAFSVFATMATVVAVTLVLRQMVLDNIQKRRKRRGIVQIHLGNRQHLMAGKRTHIHTQSA